MYLRVGELDPGCPTSANEELVQLGPGVSLDTVAGCGHALLVEDTAGTIAKIVELIGGTRRRQSPSTVATKAARLSTPARSKIAVT